MAKKEKKIPAKQQYYEQIISKQLYGAPPTREEGIAKLQADYDAWNQRQEGIAKLQADYDAWHKSQQPVEQPKAEMPKVEKAETPKAERQKSYAELHPESIPKSISYDEIFGKKKNVEVKSPEEKVYKTHADIIPSLTKANVEKQKKKEQSITKVAKQLGITEEEVKERMKEPTPKTAFKAPNESTLKSADKKVEKEALQKYLDPNKKLSKQEKREAKELLKQIKDEQGNKIKNTKGATPEQIEKAKDIFMTPEEEEISKLSEDLSTKINPIYSMIEGIVSPYRRIAKAPDKALNKLESKIRYGEAQIFDALGATQNAKEEALRKNAESLTELENEQERMDNLVSAATTQNPIPTTAGKLGGTLSQYYFTNGIFDAAAGALGATSAAGKFAANQLGQNAQDLVLDILPQYKEFMADGYLSPEEEKELKINAAINIVGNAIPGLIGYAGESAKAAKATAESNEAFRKNALEGYEKLKALNAEDAAKQAEIPKVNRPLVTSFEAEPINITKAEPTDFENLLKQNYDIGAEEAAKDVRLPDETFEQIDSYFEALAEPMNKLQRSGIMETVTDEKALKEWDNLNKAYSDYLNKAQFSDNLDDITAAKKNLDATRKRFSRAMKNIDPEIASEFNASSYGRNVGRPLNARNTITPNQEEVDEAFNLITELEESNNPGMYDNARRVTQSADVEGANPLQTFAEGNGTDEWKTSKWRTNTAEKTGKIKNADDLPEREYAYRVFKEVEQRAVKEARYKDSKDIFKDLMDVEQLDEVDVKAAMDEWERLMEIGDPDSLRKARRLSHKIENDTREGGRVVQALAEYSRSTPEGQLREAQRAINDIVDKKSGKGTSEALDNLVEKINKAYDKSNGDIDKFHDEVTKILDNNLRNYASGKTAKKMASKAIKGKDKVLKLIDSGANIEDVINEIYKQNGGVKLTAEEQSLIYNMLTNARKLPEGSYEQEELYSRAAKIAVGRAPSTIGQKIRNMLYNNMLGNFKTALSRNAFGNLGYQTLEQARQPITAVVDKLTSKVTGKRSALGWNSDKLTSYLSGLKKGTLEQVSDMWKHIDTGRSGAKGWETALANNASTYNDSNAIGKLANNIEYYVRNAMELGDRPFFEANYKQTATELYQLLDRFGKENVAGFEGIKDADIDDVVDMIASVRAADSVFQKHGKMSKGLTDLRNGLGEMSEGIIGTDVLSTAASPFTMTPGNMIERAIEYTPLGFVKNAVETGKEVLGSGFNQRRFVDEASRSIAGLPILYGTYKMAQNGLINGGYSEDPDEKKAQQEDGFIEYGFNVPDVVPYYGGKTFDTSDIPVLGPAMQTGSVIAEEGFSPAASLQAAESILGSSTTQGIRRAFGADTPSYSSNSGVVENLKNTVLSAGSQLVPSLARQTAQTIDPYKRDLGEYGTSEYYLNLVKNSDPVGRMTLPIKTNVEGKPVLQNQGRSFPAKLLENYILPMNVSEYTPSPLNQEASRLKGITGSASGFAPMATRKDLRSWDEADKIEYTEEQFRAYKQNLGELNSIAGTTLINSEFYNGLDDESKIKYLGETYSAMKQVAREKATGSIGDNTAAKVFINAGGGEDGIDAMIKHFQARDIAKSNNVSTNSKAYEAIQDAVNNGNVSEASNIASQEKEKKDTFEQYGVENNSTSRKLYENYGETALKDYADFQKEGLGASATYTYQSLKNEGGTIPSIKDFSTIYKKIDNYGDKNGSASQKEFIAYLNDGNYSVEEAEKLAQTYGDWSHVPYLKKDGTWGFHQAK